MQAKLYRMTSKTYTCLVCHSNQASFQATCTDHFVSNETFDLYQCTGCGFIFTGNAPASDEIGRYYQSSNYISHSNTNQGITNKIYHRIRNIMLGRKLALINKYARGKELLDIGCGTGYFPSFMKRNGYTVTAVEPDAESRKFALENFGLSVSAPEELLSRPAPEKYHVITLWHVLEHLHEADRYMQWIHASLKDDGLLVIAVPNCNSSDASAYKTNWAAYDVPRHLWHFTPETLEKYMKRFGFKIIKINRLPFDAYYNSMMSARYARKPLSILHGICVGFVSNLVSLFKPRRCSSVIYLLGKAEV